MSFFTVGNLLTIGILTAVLILFRYLDRHNRSVDLAREFGKRLKEELARYVAERETAVKDYALELDVQQKAARELLKHLQVTDEEFAGKAAAIAKIDEQISAYDTSLEELIRMTGMVDENLKRIEEESAFVENVYKRVSRAKDKLDALERGLSEVEQRFERENAASLEQAADSLMASVRSSISDLTVQAETIERKVEDHREAVDRVEKTREENLARDMDLIHQTFNEALERAAARADKVEDAALVKLREQALERVQRYQAAVEEKLKAYQENTKLKAAETQGLIKTYKDEWKNDSAEIEAKQKAYRDEWKKDVLELNELARGQKETWKNDFLELKAFAKAQQETWKQEIAREEAAARDVLTSLERAAADTQAALTAKTAALEDMLTELGNHVGGEISRIETALSGDTGVLEKRLEELRAQAADAGIQIEGELRRAVEDAEGQARVLAEENLEKWRHITEAADAKVRDTLDFLEAASARQAEKNAAEIRNLENVQNQFDEFIAQGENRVSAEIRLLEDRLRELRQQFDEVITRGAERIAAEEAAEEGRLGELREYAAESAAGIKNDVVRMMEETGQKAAAMAGENLEQWRRMAEAADAKIRDTLAALETASAEQRKNIAAETEAAERRLTELRAHVDDAIAQVEAHVEKAAETAQEQALEAADQKLEEYRAAQQAQYRQLEALADDTARLDTELRGYMRETEDRVREDFALYEQEAAQYRSSISAEFTAAAQGLKNEMDEVEKGLAALKAQAYDNVSEKLQVFEDEFFQDLSRRSDAIDRHLEEWHTAMNAKLAEMADETTAERRNIELAFGEQLKHRLQEQHDRFVAELEHLKAETGAFEEGIREQMGQADLSLTALKEQLDRELKEARNAAEVSAKAEIGRYGLSMAEALKQHQRELEGSFKGLSDWVNERNTEITELLETSRRETEEWQYKFSAQLRDADSTIDEARRRARELAAESDERLAAIRSSIEEIHEEAAIHRTELFAHSDEQARNLEGAIREAERHLKDFVNQTKLFDKADALKTELEHHIEDLEADMASLDQRRSETAELEAQFTKIKRLEDDISSRMTRFLSEKRRIELMEADFGRILQTSQAVEEKLAQISTSDDTLQAIQVRIRQLNDAMADAEEKYQRIEKKNQTLEATNTGIDRNFKILQETEATVRRLSGDLDSFSQDLESVRGSIEKLNQENERAQEASEKLSALDLTVTDIEQRIEAMQVAREWLARTETRLDELNRQIQDQLKLMGSLLKEERGKGAPKEKGAPPRAVRENVIKLHRQGWSVDEIARSLKLAKGEVELILELGAVD
jgi:DNA repair exonuclease SbcCD ATPase subunit